MKRNNIMHLIMLTIITTTIPACSMEQKTPQENKLENKVVLCTGDTCMQATITPYNAARDEQEVKALLSENPFKIPQITPEVLEPYFTHKAETMSQPTPTGQTVTGDVACTTYVLRSTEKVLGFICYAICFLQEPMQMTTGNIALLSAAPEHQNTVEEQLLNYALQDLNQKKTMTISMTTHEDNEVQRTTIEKLGFISLNEQIKAMKAMAEQTGRPVPAIPSHICVYMKNFEENVPEAMRQPATPIESSLLNITSENFEQEVMTATQPVVIDAYADWCGPCRQFAPIFEEVAAENNNYKFVRFNLNENAQELAQKLDIQVIPTLIFVNNREIKGKETGAMNKETLQKKLTQYFS